MNTLIPNRLLFAFEIPLRYRGQMPAIDGTLTGWTADDALPPLSRVEGLREFAEVFACWNETGLAFACRVTGKRRPVHCDPKAWWTADNIRICIDTRDARTNKRATRYCQQFYLLPRGGGVKGADPVVGIGKIQRAREEAPAVSEEQLRIAATLTDGGYDLEAFLPRECLNGFDPVEHPRIGFYYIVEDSELGQQYLTVGDDLNWHVDPSTWATAVLRR